MHIPAFAHRSISRQALARLIRPAPDEATSTGTRLLGAICYAADVRNGAVSVDDVPVLPVCMPCLGGLTGEDGTCEIWHGGALTEGHAGDVSYRHDGELLFGCMTLDEARFEARANETPLQRAAASAYDQLFTLLRQLNFPHLYRVWNYLSDINGASKGLERYRQFNLGRQASHEDHGLIASQDFPAACALGTAGGPLAIAFIAGRNEPVRVENPRQTSAYHYPPQYGPRTPLFSRATLAGLNGELLLLISGTASVVGHETLHAGDVILQTREALANLRRVVNEANRLANSMPTRAARPFGMNDLAMRVYVRHAQDLADIQGEVGGDSRTLYLKADICRADLLVEIEAHASLPVAPSRSAP